MNIGKTFVWLIFLAATCWGTMAIVYSNLPAALRRAAAWAFPALALASIVIPATDNLEILFFLSVFAPVLAWWRFTPASNDRDWQPDLAKLASADITGDTVVIHNIRNCDYRSETDFIVRHYDKTFDLGSLRKMDLFLVDWGLPHMAHAMLSFGFDGDEYVCFSIEARKKKGEKYSAVRGFFRQYELIYVVSDERDVIRLRTNHRIREDVYLYRLKASPELARQIFMDYLRKVNRLKETPEWYNAMTGNCATGMWKHIAPYYSKAKFDWRILASGHAAEMAYELGALDRTLSFQELKRLSLINPRCKAAGLVQDFSKIIRQGLPGFE